MIPLRVTATTTTQGQFRSKLEGFQRAKHIWICTSCGAWTEAKDKTCANTSASPNQSICGGKLHHFASRAEARRYGDLQLMRAYGDISELDVHPRFPCKVQGKLVCTYIADFAYTDRQRRRVVEDVKGNRLHTDDSSALRRKLAEAIYNMTVRIVEL